jgi:hypothetical protein
VPCWSEAEIPLSGHMKASDSCKIQVITDDETLVEMIHKDGILS